MSEKEYIEREALNILFAGACAECRDSCAEFDGIEADCNQCLLNGVIKYAKSIHAADVREVVLCQDCVHFQQFRPHDGFCKIDGMLWNNDFFCANGAKREES